MRVFSATFAAALRREPSLSPWRLAHWSQRARRWYQDGVSWLVLSLSYRLNCRQHLLLRESISPFHDYASGNLRHSVWLVRLCRDELRGPALSAIHSRTFPWSYPWPPLVGGLLIHMFGIGLPIALVT